MHLKVLYKGQEQTKKTNLDMTELSDLHARVGHRNGAALLEALEEPLLHRVVVERPIDVHWSNGSPWSALALQKCLGVQLSFVSALGIHSVNLSRSRSEGCSFVQLQRMQQAVHEFELQSQVDYNRLPQSVGVDRISSKLLLTSRKCICTK